MNGIVDRADIYDLGIGDAVLVDYRWHRVKERPHSTRRSKVVPDTSPSRANELVYVVAHDWDGTPVFVTGRSTVSRIPAPVLEALASGAPDPYRT